MSSVAARRFQHEDYLKKESITGIFVDAALVLVQGSTSDGWQWTGLSTTQQKKPPLSLEQM
jgi:hypothetical protein